MITIFSFQIEYEQVVNVVRSVRNVFITFLFLMSFCAYAGSYTQFNTLHKPNPAAQLESSLTAVTSVDNQHTLLSDNGSVQEVILLKQKLVKQNTTAVKQAVSTAVKLLSQKSPASKQQPKLKDGIHVDPGLSRNAYLLSDYQRQPVYQLEIEFNPPLAPTQKSTPSFAANDFRPWFLSTCSSSPARIAGWKESNSLYSGSITYHS